MFEYLTPVGQRPPNLFQPDLPLRAIGGLLGTARPAMPRRRVVPLEQSEELRQRPRRYPGGIGHRLHALALQIEQLPGDINRGVPAVGAPAHASVKLVKILGQRRFDPQNRRPIHAHDLLSTRLTQESHRTAA